jgi:hypothetical protein
MLSKIKIALVAALVATTATAAVARTVRQQPQQTDRYGVVVTDEGQGRFVPADIN